MYVFEKLQKIVDQDHSQAGDALRNVLELHHHSEGGMCAHCGGQEDNAECDTIQAIAASYYPEWSTWRSEITGPA